jgi:hypothetical protein
MKSSDEMSDKLQFVAILKRGFLVTDKLKFVGQYGRFKGQRNA